MSQGQSLNHLIFSTKYRYSLLASQSIALQCERLIHYIASVRGVQIRAIAIQPDHVHVMFVLPRTETIAMVAQEFKRFSSLRLRQQFKSLNEHRAFWAKSYYHRSVGGGEAAVEKYIRDQRIAGLKEY